MSSVICMTCPLPLGCCYYYIIPRFDAKHNPPRPFVGETTTTPAHPLFFLKTPALAPPARNLAPARRPPVIYQRNITVKAGNAPPRPSFLPCSALGLGSGARLWGLPLAPSPLLRPVVS
jgi:hypothetical protein